MRQSLFHILTFIIMMASFSSFHRLFDSCFSLDISLAAMLALLSPFSQVLTINGSIRRFSVYAFEVFDDASQQLESAR